jgi:ElaB/YqjD/DUF883 family membrane-anchored ribosome-binding protein
MTDVTMREHDLARDVKAVLRDVEALLDAVNQESRDGIAAARPRVEAGIRDARSRLAEMDAELAARTRRLAARTDAYVHRHPWEVAAGAIAAGALIGAAAGVLLARLYEHR